MMMMPFSTRTGLERVRVVGPDLDLCWTDPQAIRRRARGYDCYCSDRQVLSVAHLCKKNKKEGGSARASPMVAPMPKSVSF